jgi:hypothetical protein
MCTAKVAASDIVNNISICIYGSVKRQCPNQLADRAARILSSRVQNTQLYAGRSRFSTSGKSFLPEQVAYIIEEP